MRVLSAGVRVQFAAILKLYMAKYGDAKEQGKGQPKKRRKASAFLVYSAEMREQVKSKMDDTATLADQAKELGVMWKALDAKEKEVWKQKAEAIDVAEEAALGLQGEEAQALEAAAAAAAASPVADEDDDEDEDEDDDE